MPLANPKKFINDTSSLRKASPIRDLMPLMRIPGMISLGGGLPNPIGFPIDNIEISLKNGETIKWSPKDVMTALQYSNTFGIDELRQILIKYNCLLHNKIFKPPNKNTKPTADMWNVLVTAGSQDGLSKTFDMLISENDSIIVATPVYPGTLANLLPKKVNIIGIPVDNEGMNTSIINDKLKNWYNNDDTKSKPFPKVIYTIPTGSNPSGSTLSINRRKELLNIANEYDLLILEDDPYYLLSFEEDTDEILSLPSNDIRAWNVFPSLWSMDTNNRVIRFDSFSKVLSAGFRIGYVSAPMAYIQRLALHVQASMLHNSGVSQMMAIKVLNNMGQDGFLKHVRKVRSLYANRRDCLINACKKYLTGKATWNYPAAGMFVWITLNNVTDTWDLITKKAVEAKVLLVPGTAFDLNGNISNCLRASYSVANPEQIDQAIQRLANIIDNNQ